MKYAITIITIIACHLPAFGKNIGVVVDTHIGRLSRRSRKRRFATGDIRSEESISASQGCSGRNLCRLESEGSESIIS